MRTTKKLQMTFLNGAGKQHRYTPKDARDGLSAEVVRGTMQQMVDLACFQKNGVPHCTAVGSAKYIETIETDIFDDLATEVTR